MKRLKDFKFSSDSFIEAGYSFVKTRRSREIKKFQKIFNSAFS